MSDDLIPQTRITRYQVSCLREDHPDADAFTLTVEYRGRDRWAVTRMGAHYDADGGRSWGFDWPGNKEPVTEEEIAAADQARVEWLSRHRFDLSAALAIAEREAPKVTVNGWTIPQVLAEEGSARG